MGKRSFFILLALSFLLLTGCEFTESEPTRNVHFIGIGLSYNEYVSGKNTDGVAVPEGGNLYAAGDELTACTNDVTNVYTQFASRGYDSFTSYSGSGDDSQSLTYITDEDTTQGLDSYDRCISALETVAATASDSDLTIFYYSGHGWSGGSLALSIGAETVDLLNTTTTTNEPTTYLVGTLLDIEDLLTYLSAIPGDKLVLVDSCYSGSLVTDWADDTSEGIERFFADHGDSNIYILTASSDSEKSYASSTGSYFTNALVAELAAHSEITFSELYSNVKSDTSYKLQTATTNSSLPLDLVL